jgi:hypothetical protein
MLGVPIAAVKADAGDRPVVTTKLIAVVWPSGYSEVFSPSSCAVSNIDFTVFGPLVRIETPETIYEFKIRWSERSAQDIQQDQQNGDADEQGFPVYWPASLPPREGPPRFVPISAAWAAGDQAPQERALLSLLHQYYQANRFVIDAQAPQARIDQDEALAAEAAQRQAELQPPGPPVIFDRIEVAPPTPTPSQP